MIQENKVWFNKSIIFNLHLGRLSGGDEKGIRSPSDQLTLLEIVLDGNGYPITVNLWDFTYHLIRAVEVYLQLIEKLLIAIEFYSKSGKDHTKLTRISENLVKARTNDLKIWLGEFKNILAEVGLA